MSDKRFSTAVVWGMLPDRLSVADRFTLCKEVGFDGVEAPPLTDPKEIEAMRAASDSAGIPIHSVIFGGWDAPLSHPDASVRAKGAANLTTGLETAKLLGADALLLVPAVVNAETPYRDAYERSQREVRRLIPIAEKTGVPILIEVVWNNFLLSPLEFARYVDEFKHPLVQAYFDVGNVVAFAWPQDWIRTLGKRIKKVHIKDFKGGPGLFGAPGGQWVNLGDGSVPWLEVRKALDEIGYHGWITCELPGGDADYLRDVRERMNRLLLR